MPEFLAEVPGRVYVLATGLPLVAFVVLLLAGMIRRMQGHHLPGRGDRIAAGFAIGCMVASAVLSIIGLAWYLQDARTHADMPSTMEERWAESVDWISLGNFKPDYRPPASTLTLGYHIDHLTALMFAMVTVIGSLIFLFSFGYMREELENDVHDHQAHVHRRGRFARFYLYLSLFAFSMLTILLADNLMQAFIGWELVGVSSFFLIGFYTERHSASTAANKAFIMNRIGDAGFLIGLGTAWAQFGTFDIQELITRVTQPGVDPFWITVMGLGIFAGCVGKSAQVPLHTWLPDAMEGPTPVSALIHAATMVAAGVYLVGRVFPLFNADVLLVIAYVGAITLFLSAIVATVQNDIKRVLAYSTCSQLGYMMLALGIGGWTAGLLHLLTHAFFKALLFLGAGSVIHGLHHEQDLRNMGGLRKRMPITAYTMLVGVAAIVGVPFFSGWYSKDMILAHVVGTAESPKDPLLFLLPVITVALTGYYMMRMWLMAFAGEPRDHHVSDHAHESPRIMTSPLVILALFSVGIAWGWPLWEVEASYLGQVLHSSEPKLAVIDHAHHLAHKSHSAAMIIGLIGGLVGVGTAIGLFRAGKLTPAKTGQRSALHAFLYERLYFDQLYDLLFTRPTLALAGFSGRFDKRPTGKTSEDSSDYRLDPGTLDGALSAIGQGLRHAGLTLHGLQTGRLRSYILILGLTVVVLLGILLARLQ